MEMTPTRLNTGYDPTDWAWSKDMVEWLLKQQMTGSIMLSIGSSSTTVEEGWAKDQLMKSLIEGTANEIVKRYPDTKRTEGVSLVHPTDFMTSFEVEEYTDMVPGRGPALDIRVESRVMRMHAAWRPRTKPLMMSADGSRYWILDRMIDAHQRHADIEVHHSDRRWSLEDRLAPVKTSRYAMVGWLSDQHRWLYQEVKVSEPPQPEQPEPEKVDEARFGPQSEHVAALIERASALTSDQVARLREARDAEPDETRNTLRWAGEVAIGVGRAAAWDAARNKAWSAAGGAAWNAVSALVVRDLISTGAYDELTRTWRTVVGPIHPDDDIQVGES